jgi:hypothetical protein
MKHVPAAERLLPVFSAAVGILPGRLLKNRRQPQFFSNLVRRLTA